MSKYLKILIENNCINQNQSDGIQAMYNNLTSYNFNDIFSENDIIHSQKLNSINISNINVGETITNLFNENSVNVPFMLIRNTIVNTTTNCITKTHIVKDTYPDDIKHAIIMHLLRGIYFQDLAYKENIKIGNNTLIIPEILRYGSITLNNNDQIIFFTSPYYVDSSPPSFSHGNSDRYQYVLDFKNLINLFNNGLTDFERVTNSLQIKHNDIFSCTDQYTEEYFDQLFQVVEENDPLKINSIYETFLKDSTVGSSFYNCDYTSSDILVEDWFKNFNYDNVKDLPFTNTGNIFKYNDKVVIIDFEHCGSSGTQFHLNEICNYIYNRYS